MAKWKPLGSLVLVKLHTTGSNLALEGTGIQYNGLATVLEVGPKVEGVAAGDVVMVNGPQGIIAHKELGEDVGLLSGPLLLAKQEAGGVIES